MQRVLVCFALCALALGCGKPPAKKPIPIGAIYALTGPNGTAGNNQLDAAVLAVEEINGMGGVLGAQLELTVRDDASDATKAKDAATEITQTPGVKVIIGSNPSPNTKAIVGVGAPAKVPQCSSGSVSADLTTLADDGYLYRTVPSDTTQYRLQAKRARDKGFSKVAILHVPGLQGTTPAAAFNTAFTSFGGTVTINKEWVAGQASYASTLTEVYNTNPEAITLMGPVTDSAQIIKDYLAGFAAKGTFWFFMNAQNQDFVVAVGGSNFTFQHEGTRPTVAANNDRFPGFHDRFVARYNKEPNNFGQSNAYDCAYILALAIQAAGDKGLTDGSLIRDQMIPVSKGGTAYGPGSLFKEASAAISRGEDVNYQGASGDVDFDDNGDVTGGYDIWKVVNGVQANQLTDIPPPP